MSARAMAGPAARVVFRADASAAIGLGHVARCLALAQALMAQGGRCGLVVREPEPALLARCQTLGLDCLALPPTGLAQRSAEALWPTALQRQDAALTLSLLQAQHSGRRADGRPDWIVVDHYGLDDGWHDALRESAGPAAPRLAAIDDMANRPLAVELLIDHNHAPDHRAKYQSHLPASAALLTGPVHALLGPAYARAAPHLPGPVVRSIGIFMGGADHAGLSAVALRAVTLAGFNGPVQVASTSANPHLASLAQAVALRPQTDLLLDQPDLSRFLARHDLQIGAGGGATWERCCLGVPTLAVAVAANQRAVLEPLADLGVVVLARHDPHDARALATSLRPLLAQAAMRQRLSLAARTLVDGRGAQRVAQWLLASARPELSPPKPIFPASAP